MMRIEGGLRACGALVREVKVIFDAPFSSRNESTREHGRPFANKDGRQTGVMLRNNMYGTKCNGAQVDHGSTQEK